MPKPLSETNTHGEPLAQNQFEEQIVLIFADMADIFGNPPSLGAIFGLLFASKIPLSMEEIVSKLEISKGSASQGLRQLEELGAVFRTKQDGERTSLYTAGLELKPLLSVFLTKRLLPRLATDVARIDRLKNLLPELPADIQPDARLRLQRLTKWHRRANTFLPFAQKFLQAD